MRSTYCYLLAEEDACDETTWGVHLLDLTEQGLDVDYTVTDGGRALRAGQVAALILYLVGRFTQPRHRIMVFSIALTFFFLGGLANATLFSTDGVVAFALCMAMARPLHDIAYSDPST